MTDQKTDGDMEIPLERYRGHFELGSTKPQERTVCMRIFYGDPGLAGKLTEKAGEQAVGYDRCKQLEGEGALALAYRRM